jgi:hypothetical protein
MKRSRLSSFLSAVLAIAGGVGVTTVAPSPAARADTDFVREFAKNRPPVVLVTSGPAAAAATRRLEEAIRRSHDFARRSAGDLSIVTLADAPNVLARSSRRQTVVFLLAGKDLADSAAPVPAALAPFLPVDAAAAAKERLSVVRSVKDSDRPGELAFRIGLFAPDAERLGRVMDELLARRTDDFRSLPFERRHATNRVAVFAPPGWEDTLKGWGKINQPDVWNDCRAYLLSDREKMTPEQLEETAEVYLVDRSRVAATDLPAPAARLLAARPVKDTTVVVTREQTEDGRPIVVVSAPSRMLLFARISGRPTIGALGGLPPVTEALNLSRVGSTSLLVLGGGRDVTPDMLASLHAHLSKSLREDYHVAVEPRGPVLAKLEADLAVQMARGAEGTQGMLQRRYPTRYVWVFTLTDVTGGTTYTPSERRLTPKPSTFTDTEPSRPVRKKDESDDDYDRRKRDYRDRWDRWDRARRDYAWHYDNDSVDWELSISREDTAHVRGLLQLIDTKSPNGARVVWEKEAAREEKERRPHRTQRASVRGHDARPNSLDVPGASDRCSPSLLLAAARGAGTAGLRPLAEEALLSETPPPAAPASSLAAGDVTTPVADPAPNTARPAPAAVGVGKIAEVEGKTVTLNIGANGGVRVGDRFEVLLRYKETLDPDTGRVLRVRVFESLVVMVTHVDAEVADAQPATPQDAAKLASARVGTPVRRAAAK